MKQLEYEELAKRPIPEIPSLDGWKDVPIRECNELLVPLGVFTDYTALFTDSLYYGERKSSPYLMGQLEGSLLTMFVRKGVAERLLYAQALLPRGFYLVVWDAYRTLQVQQSLYENYLKGLMARHSDWDSETLGRETQKYVSLPSQDRLRPSPHNTGGSVDVTMVELPEVQQKSLEHINHHISLSSDWDEVYYLEMRRLAILNQEAKALSFGTPLDYGGIEASLSYFEESGGEERDNRRVLYHVMTESGFQPYPDEWWHYNYGNQMAARTAGLDYAIYGAVNLSEQNISHEKLRINHLKGSLRLLNGVNAHNKLVSSPDLRVAQQAALRAGDLRISQFPQAAVIEPSR